MTNTELTKIREERNLSKSDFAKLLDGYYEGLKILLNHMAEMGLASEDLLLNVTFAENLEKIKRVLEGEGHAT